MKIEYTNELSPGDFNALRKSAGWKELKEEYALASIRNTAFLVAAQHEGKTVGMARVINDGGYIVFIADVIVLPNYQRMGIGKAMMGRVMDYIQQSLGEGQHYMVNLLSSKGKEAFYSDFGFQIRPNDTGGAGMIQWIYNES